MLRRWIIRGFFITLLSLCIGGWIFTTFYQWQFGYAVGGGLYGVSSTRGFVGVSIGRGNPGFTGSDFMAERLHPAQLWPSQTWALPDDSIRAHFGFGLGHFKADDGFQAWWVVVPHWLLTGVSAGLLWLVWRKTRPKPDPRTAFPVEPRQTVPGKHK